MAAHDERRLQGACGDIGFALSFGLVYRLWSNDWELGVSPFYGWLGLSVPRGALGLMDLITVALVSLFLMTLADVLAPGDFWRRLAAYVLLSVPLQGLVWFAVAKCSSMFSSTPVSVLYLSACIQLVAVVLLAYRRLGR